MDSLTLEQELERIRPGVLAILQGAVRDRGLAEDLCGEAIRIALERLQRQPLDEPLKLDAYVAQTARNLAIAEKRKAARRRTLTGEQESLDAHVDDEADVAADAHRESRARAVRTILEELPTPRDRTILVRYYLEDDDKEAICNDLGLTPAHFNRVVFRARERFRELLERRYDARDLLSVLVL
jgi:RNA polymerase sigma-70 factor (ECF subfamily)